MFKKLALILAITVASTAQAAQPTCWPNLSQGITLTIKPVGSTDPIAVGDIIYSASDLGLIWGYACIFNGTWYHNVAGGAWSEFPANWAAIADVLIRGTDADRVAAWTKYTTTAAIDPRLQTDVDKIKTLLPRPPPIIVPPPPSEIWKVLADPFRTDKKRLVYNVVAGKRATATTQLVSAGDLCDPVTKITEPGPVYFLSVLGSPALVARCVKQ